MGHAGNVQAGYSIEIASDSRRARAVKWMWLSVLSLLAAGIFSVMLVLARSPGVGEHLPFADFFHTALVIHVDLSVLVWILAFTGVLWSLAARPGYDLFNRSVFALVTAATGLLAISAFLPDAQPVMSNYIPVLDNPIFIAGLILFGAGISLLVISAMTITPPVGRNVSKEGVIRFGLNCAAISVLVAIGAFGWSWLALPTGFSREFYFESLFWGGGHVLQYTYTLVMMVGWLWLADVARIRLLMSERIVLLVFFTGLLSVFIAPLIYYRYDVTDPAHRQMFTWLMSFGGSLATFPLGLAIYIGLIQHKPADAQSRSAHSALMTSLLLFGCGGVIGFMIDGSDVTIPAHYHGCIVGVTLALMGTGYEVVSRLGYERVNFKWSNIQLWVYGTGQFLHILGLVWSGGYGVQRKTAGAAQGLDSIERIAGMGVMGFGGLLSAVGGFMFVFIVVKALSARPGSQSEFNDATIPTRT